MHERGEQNFLLHLEMHRVLPVIHFKQIIFCSVAKTTHVIAILPQHHIDHARCHGLERSVYLKPSKKKGNLTYKNHTCEPIHLISKLTGNVR